MNKQDTSIIIIGTGKVAKNLGLKFSQIGYPISGIWGRNKTQTQILSKELKTQPLSDFQKIPNHSIALICVADTAIVEVVNLMPKTIKIAYTSGSVQLKDLPHREHLGVFYPLQTFSNHRSIDISEVPFLIEATTKEFEIELKQLAERLSSKVIVASSEDRYNLHIAAVLVNNFTNYLFYLAKDHLEEHHLEFDLLKPLIKETVSKLDDLEPMEAQTGPAIRGDKNIINSHINSISRPETKQIYQLFSELIGKGIKKL